MDLDQIIRGLAGPEQFAALQQLVIEERIRYATEGGERYVPSAGRPGEGFAVQADQDSYDFGTHAKATVAPAWRNEATMSSLAAILQHAAGRFIDLVSPRSLLMILARGDAIVPPASIRAAFARAGEPKRLLEIEGGHYTVYTGSGADTAAQAATQWFTEHLVSAKAVAP
jgi:uncharacterized protein